MKSQTSQSENEKLQSIISNDYAINQQEQNVDRPFLQRAFGPIGKGAMRGAILALLASAMGTGIFNLPLRISQIGIIPFTFFIILCGLYSYLGMMLISQIILQHKVKSYSQMAQISYGNVLKRIGQFCLIIYPWGITICFQVIVARFSVQLLHDKFHLDLYKNRQNDIYNDKGNLIRILINIGVILCALPFIFKRDISTIKKLAYIGVASVLFNVSVVVGTSFFGFTKLDQQGHEVVYHGIFAREKGNIKWVSFDNAESFSILLQGVASIFFCYVSHQMVFPLTNDLKKPTSRRLNKIFIRTHVTQLIVYSCVGFFAYLLLVQHQDQFEIQPLAIASISTDIMSLGKAIMIVALFVAIPLNMFPAREVFTQSFKIDTTTNRVHFIVCLGLSLSSCLIAVVFQKVNSYFGLLGGTAGVMMAGGIPAMCYWKLMKMTRNYYIILTLIGVITILAMAGAVMSVVNPV